MKAMLTFKKYGDGISFQIGTKENGVVTEKSGFVSNEALDHSLYPVEIDITDLLTPNK